MENYSKAQIENPKIVWYCGNVTFYQDIILSD